MTRTFSRADWDAAQAAWRDGEFSDEWREYRHQAAMRGMLYPPTGTKSDGWDDDEPSQRALLIRAIRETPTLLRECIASSRSWGEVVAKVVRKRDDWRLEAEERDRHEREDRPTDRQALMSLKAIVDRVAQS